MPPPRRTAADPCSPTALATAESSDRPDLRMPRGVAQPPIRRRRHRHRRRLDRRARPPSRRCRRPTPLRPGRALPAARGRRRVGRCRARCRGGRHTGPLAPPARSPDRVSGCAGRVPVLAGASASPRAACRRRRIADRARNSWPVGMPPPPAAAWVRGLSITPPRRCGARRRPHPLPRVARSPHACASRALAAVAAGPMPPCGTSAGLYGGRAPAHRINGHLHSP